MGVKFRRLFTVEFGSPGRSSLQYNLFNLIENAQLMANHIPRYARRSFTIAGVSSSRSHGVVGTVDYVGADALDAYKFVAKNSIFAIKSEVEGFA